MRKRVLIPVAVILLATGTSEAQGPQYPAGPPAPSPTTLGSSDQAPPSGLPGPLQGPTLNPWPSPGNVPATPDHPAPVPGPTINTLQPPPTMVAPPAGLPLRTDGPIVNPPQPQFFVPDRPDPRCLWVNVDYLLWWIKPGPLPSPLVTTGPASDPVPGSLGSQGPNTTILYGGHNIDFGTFSGGRFDVGFWLPQCPLIGFDAGFFGLQSRSVNFAAASDANGDQILARPVIGAQTGTETVYIDSYPGAASGAVTVTSTTQLYSWEINMDANLLHTRNFNWDVTVGFRALDLTEDLTIQDVVLPLSSAAGFTFLGAPVGSISTLSDFDRFQTTNHFYGGQIGTRANWSTGPWDLSLSAKLALGATQQTINVEGASFLFTPGSVPVTAPGGILAQPTNMGRFTRSAFTVVPEGGLNVGYQFNPWLRFQAGYTFLYWSNVVRPGDQIDRTVNFTQVPTDATYNGTASPARPVLTPQTTDFWAQGVNFGLEFRF
jgi:hypothetical protein